MLATASLNSLQVSCSFSRASSNSSIGEGGCTGLDTGEGGCTGLDTGVGFGTGLDTGDGGRTGLDSERSAAVGAHYSESL